jgi:hypothetical protein
VKLAHPLIRQRWQVSDDGASATLSKRWTRGLLYVAAGVGNLVLPSLSGRLFGRPNSMGTMELVIVLAFFAWALREFFFRVRYSFKSGFFQVTSGPLAFIRDFEQPLPISEIETFTVISNLPEPFELHVRLRSGVTHCVPAPLDGVVWRINGGKPLTGVASAAAFDFVAEWLNAALDRAKHEGGTYRVAAGADERVSESAAPSAEARVSQTR